MEELLKENFTTIVGAVVLLVLIGAVVKMLSPKKKVFAEDMTLNVRCRACGWQGTVTKYNQVCRKCNESDLEQM